MTQKEQPSDSTQQPEHNNSEFQFMIQRIYIKDLSFEAPNTPAIFQQEWQPELNLELQNMHKQLSDNIYEVILGMTVTVKNQNQIAFLVEIKQAGIFTIEGTQAPQQLEHLLESFCPNILFPYAREAITNEVTRGSFPQLVLAPINFEALYLNKLHKNASGQHQAEIEEAK